MGLSENAATAAIEHVFDPPLVAGRLVRRYKRFLADVVLADGREVTAHCANTGRMKGLVARGSRVWLTPHDNPKRKLQWTWEIASEGDVLVGINTGMPNRLAAAAVAASAIDGFRGYRSVRREVRYGKSSRIDVLAEDNPDDPRPCYIELKNVTLVEGDAALFPDAVTARGLKHLHELRDMATEGARAVVFFLVQRADAERFAPAVAVDPAYAAALAEVAGQGVEVFAWQAAVSPRAIGLARPLPVSLEP